ncbi:MAG: exodeoxyribonuclease VII small subunit [Clostridia bacterium]|nr:exodeoxyribonuclease VII small subunit [Clostridia bacterium]
MATKQEKLSFEENLAGLQQIVERLERGDIALDESVALYEEGMRYAQAMNGQLKKAAGKVTTLEKKQAAFEESLFELQEDADV